MGQKGEFQELDPAWKKKNLGTSQNSTNSLELGMLRGAKFGIRKMLWMSSEIPRIPWIHMIPQPKENLGEFTEPNPGKKIWEEPKVGLDPQGRFGLIPLQKILWELLGFQRKFWGVWGNVGKGENLQNSGLWILWDHGMVGND